MKFFLVIFLSIQSINVFANCEEAYIHASKKRDLRNEILVDTVATSAAVGAALITGANVALAIGYGATMATAYPVMALKRQGEIIYLNNFDKLLLTFHAAQAADENEVHLKKLIKDVAKKSDSEVTNEISLKIRRILNDGFEDEKFCPIKRERLDGSPVYSVYKYSELRNFLANVIKQERLL